MALTKKEQKELKNLRDIQLDFGKKISKQEYYRLKELESKVNN